MAPYNSQMQFPVAIVAVNSVGIVLSFFAMVLRFWVRHIRRIKMRLTDYTLVGAWVFALALVIDENLAVTLGGAGQEASGVTVDQLILSAKLAVVAGVVQTLTVALIKISFLDFFLSIFEVHKAFRIVNFVLMGITTAYGLSYTIISLAACRPFEANWDKISYPDYTCIDTSMFYTSSAAIGAILDVAILITPIPMVWAIHAKTSTKLGLTVLFTIGILICGISFVRLYYNSQAARFADQFPEYLGTAAILSTLEANLSIICACLPAFPAVLRPLVQKMKSSFDSGSGRSIRGLIPFSLKASRRPTRATVRLHHSESGGSHPWPADDVEAAQLQNKRANDRLYPLSMTAVTRASVEDEPATFDEGYIQARTTITAESTRMNQSTEMAMLRGRVEPFGVDARQQQSATKFMQSGF